MDHLPWSKHMTSPQIDICGAVGKAAGGKEIPYGLAV